MASTRTIERTKDDARLVIRAFKRARGKIIIDAEAWSGGELVHTAEFPLLDQRESAHFIAVAGRERTNADWHKMLVDVSMEVREALDAAEHTVQAPNDPAPTPWKSGKDLMSRTFVNVHEVVPGILPVGVMILASSPKLGKSRFMLDIALAVSQGGKALGGIDVEQGDVLYLCLEDSEQLLQERLFGLLQDVEMPDNFDYASEWRRFDEGGIEDIERWLVSHPNAKLVVVDIFQRVKPIGKCSSLITSGPLLDYIVPFQLALAENDTTVLLTLFENVLGLRENNLITSGASRIP